MANSKRKANRLVTEHLKDLADSVEGMDDEGVIITKARKLAGILWDFAIGKSKVDIKTGKTERILPMQWAIQIVLDRLEGHVAKASEDTSDKPQPADRIDKLTKDRINKLAESVTKSGRSSSKQ